MKIIQERGTTEYLEQIEASLCLAYTTLGLVLWHDSPKTAEPAVAILNDLAPLVAAIIDRVEDEAMPATMADEIEAAGLTRVAVRVRLRLAELMRRRGLRS